MNERLLVWFFHDNVARSKLTGILRGVSHSNHNILHLKAEHKPLLLFSLSTVFKKEESLNKKERQANVFFLFFLCFLPLLLPAIRVLDMLPGPNKLLLQHLVCVLHHILENADINKMDAYNLAVCIAPTLLQVDGTPLDEQKEKMKKVESHVMNILLHFRVFEALWLTLQKTSKGFISKGKLAYTLACLVRC